MRPQIPLRRLVLDAVVAASIVIGLWSAPGTTPATLADCDTSIRIVTRPAEARGSTFLGTAIGVTDEPADSSVTFDVDRVYAGDVYDITTLDSGTCHPITGFRRGHRYLVSTADTTGARSDDTLAWEIVGDRAALLGFDVPASDYPRRLRDATTLECVTALMAPGGQATPPLPMPGLPVPVTYEASVHRESCDAMSGGCVRLVSIWHADYPQTFRGAQLVATDGDGPTTLTDGLPDSLPIGDYLIGASEWRVGPQGSPGLSGWTVSCLEPFQVLPQDVGELVSIYFEDDSCGAGVHHVDAIERDGRLPPSTPGPSSDPGVP